MDSTLRMGGLAACMFAASLAAQDVLAVKAGTLVTVTGATLENAVVLIEDGEITKIGTDLEVPWDARVIDASDKVVLPTYVLAHSSSGMRGNNENLANVPYLSVLDAVDPSNRFFAESLSNGVGTIHVIPGNRTLLGGQGMVVRPTGRTVEDMAVVTRSGIKVSLDASGGSRIGQLRKLRRAIEEVEEYVADYDRRKKEFEAGKAAGAIAEDKTWDEEYDRTKKPVIDMLNGDLQAWVYVPSAAEVDEAMRLAARLDAVLVLGPRCYKAATALAKLGQPVVLDDTLELWEKDPESDEEVMHCPAKILADAGVTFALSLGNGAEAYPWWQMATAIRNGVDRQTALAAMTIVPARILGLDKQVGSIEVGKVGNLQILTGDPLQATTWVETVILEGEVVYERKDDPRLKYLFGEGEAK